MSLRFLENLRRAQTGPYCKERNFDLKIFFSKLKELIKEHGIKFDPEELVPEDNSLAKDLFEAGLELFLHTGVYCKDTSRMIKFDETEVRQALRDAPSRLILGQGRDTCVMQARRIDGDTPLIIQGGPGGAAISEGEIYVKTHMSYVKWRAIHTLVSGCLPTVEGERVRAGAPTEILAAKREGSLVREAARRGGRSGMHIVGVASAATSRGGIAANDHENGYRPSDGRCIPILPELKTSFDTLCKVVNAVQYDTFIVSLSEPLVGGIAGWAEGTAVTSVATHIAGLLVNSAHYVHQGHLDLKYADSVDLKGIWISSVVGQAMTLNTHLLMMDDYWCRAGPCTEELLYQVAAKSVVSPCCGYSSVCGVGSTGNSIIDHNTGLEAEFMCEAVNAATGLKRGDANELAKTLFSRYEASLEKPPMGKSFQECYDLKTIKPSPEWQEIYERVKKEVENLGLEMG